MKRIPITLITGFLGAGKSTLINRLIRESAPLKLGLIVNEFGDVGLESQFIEAAKDEIIELSSGCMCCVPRDDLIETVRRFLDKKPDLDHLVIEASGLSDPFPIAQTFIQDTVDGRVRIDSVITVLDANNFDLIIKQFVTSIKQLKLADFIVFSKLDIVEPKELERIRHQVSILAPRVPVLSSQDPHLVQAIMDTHDFDHEMIATSKVVWKEAAGPKSKFFGAGAAPSLLNKKVYEVYHEALSTLFFRTERPMSPAKVSEFLQSLPVEIIRIKGFFNLQSKDLELSKALIQSVCSRTSVDHCAWREHELKQTALVFIARNYDMESLRLGLEECQV